MYTLSDCPVLWAATNAIYKYQVPVPGDILIGSGQGTIPMMAGMAPADGFGRQKTGLRKK